MLKSIQSRMYNLRHHKHLTKVAAKAVPEEYSRDTEVNNYRYEAYKQHQGKVYKPDPMQKNVTHSKEEGMGSFFVRCILFIYLFYFC